MLGVNFQQLREQIAMTDVLRLLQFEATSIRGDQLRGPCPLHDGQSGRGRSFSVHLRLGRYRCFGCGRRGNTLELWSAARQLNLHAASIELCERLGLEVPWIERW